MHNNQQYWWRNIPSETLWVEIRYKPGLGTELRCPVRDQKNNDNGWYKLLEAVQPGDVIYHWHPHQMAIVGRSRVMTSCQFINSERVVPLADFNPLASLVTLKTIRNSQSEVYSACDSIQERYSQYSAHYLPFQKRNEIRFMSNYFAKMPTAVAKLLFGKGGWAMPRDRETSSPDTGYPIDANVTRQFLNPFKPKADTDYVANGLSSTRVRTRAHETLVNGFSKFLREHGHMPARNQAIDIGLDEPSVVIEAKVVHNWAEATRAALGQLYEYRYFHIVSPETKLIFLASKPIPKLWIEYLETDRLVATCYFDGGAFHLSDTAKEYLHIGR